MHVVHVIESLGSGGAERLLHTNLKHLSSGDLRHTVVTVFSEGTYWTDPIRSLGVDVLSLGGRSYGDMPKAVFQLTRWLRANSPDIIHSHLFAANLVARVAGRLSGIPVISSIHSPDHEPEVWADGSNVPLWKRRAMQLLDASTAVASCSRLVAVSEYVRGSANKRLRFPIERIEVIPNPVDLEELDAPVDSDRAAFLQGLGLPASSRLVLSVARVSPAKGLLYGIRALPSILRANPEAHLISVGSTSDTSWLGRVEREARDLGVRDHVHFIGERKDVPALLQLADVFLFPSTYEGLGIALAEAMAAGCACVASAIGPIPSFVDDEVSGLLVPPTDHEAIASAVGRILADRELASTLGANARRMSRARFAPEAAAAELTRIYADVLGRR